METSSWSGQVQLGFAAAGGADSVSRSKKRSVWVWHAAARVGNAYKPCSKRRRRRRRRRAWWTQGGCSFACGSQTWNPKNETLLIFLRRRTERKEKKKKKKESHPNQFSSTQLIKMDVADKTGNESHSIFYSVCMDTVKKNTPVKVKSIESTPSLH